MFVRRKTDILKPILRKSIKVVDQKMPFNILACKEFLRVFT